MSSRKSTPPRTVALCYIRVSMLPKGKRSLSAERQRANIEHVCEVNGWTPVWFEDVGGHRSGTSDKHRPEWAKLWMRLSEPDVVAVIANDLSRLYRKGERLNSFLNVLRMHEIQLVLADPRQNFDPLADENRAYVRHIALLDEIYAQDVRNHILSSVDYRLAVGIHQGAIPFGTERNAEGQLLPSTQGAWRMPDGSYRLGRSNDRVPRNAHWYGFYEALVTMYQIFVYQSYGQHRIADQLNKMGYRYRDRQGNLALFERDDVRRILANWPEYGGYRGGGSSSRNERHALNTPPENYILDPKLAVLPFFLLTQAGERRHTVSHRQPAHIERTRKGQNFPLTHLIRCAHCHMRFMESGNPNDLTYLWGHNKSGGKKPIYTHKTQLCSVRKKSVQVVKVHSKFLQLVGSIISDLKTPTQSLSLQETAQRHANAFSIDDEEERIQKASNNIQFMLTRGMINFIEAKAQLDQLKKEQKYIDTVKARSEGASRESSVAIKIALQDIVDTWEISTDDERYELVKRVFEWIVYDLDEEKILDYKRLGR